MYTEQQRVMEFFASCVPANYSTGINEINVARLAIHNINQRYREDIQASGESADARADPGGIML